MAASNRVVDWTEDLAGLVSIAWSRTREVKFIKETAAAAKQKPSDAAAIISYDEKPGIQAIVKTAPDLPPDPGTHSTLARDHE
jgi:hypothetical protein